MVEDPDPFKRSTHADAERLDKYKQRWEKTYDRQHRRADGLFEILTKNNIITKESSVLDIGSGLGFRGGHLSQKGVSTVLVEFDFNQLLIAKSKYPAALLILADAECLPLKTRIFDCIICQHVLEHVKNPQSVVGEIIRACKVGGRIVLDTPNMMMPIHGDPLKKLKEIIFRKKNTHIGTVFTRNGVKNLFNKYEVIVEDYYVGSSIIDKIIRHIPQFRLTHKFIIIKL
jgi:ubiquinone/menaquinone biosynthesis C-methylase UbiE